MAFKFFNWQTLVNRPCQRDFAFANRFEKIAVFMPFELDHYNQSLGDFKNSLQPENEVL